MIHRNSRDLARQLDISEGLKVTLQLDTTGVSTYPAVFSLSGTCHRWREVWVAVLDSCILLCCTCTVHIVFARSSNGVCISIFQWNYYCAANVGMSRGAVKRIQALACSCFSSVSMAQFSSGLHCLTAKVVSLGSVLRAWDLSGSNWVRKSFESVRQVVLFQ